MFPRETLMGILGSLPEGDLLKALSAAGVDISSGAGGMPGTMGEAAGLGDHNPDEDLVSWNNTEVKVPQSKKRQIWDTGQFFEKPVAPQTARPMAPQSAAYHQADQAEPNIAPFAATA